MSPGLGEQGAQSGPQTLVLVESSLGRGRVSDALLGGLGRAGCPAAQRHEAVQATGRLQVRGLLPNALPGGHTEPQC